MKKEVALVCLILVLVSLVCAQPPPPPLPSAPGSAPPVSSTPTATQPSQTNITPAVQPAAPQPAAQPAPIPQETPTSTPPEEESSSGLPVLYTVLIIALVLISLGLAAYLFFKHKTKKITNFAIPENIKIYVRTNLQRGYPEEQLRQQMSMQKWSPEQINQIFDEVRHGF